MKKIKRKTKLKISVCYIAKNNAEDLKISMQSICKVADEIILTDTGSTDNTVAIAESFGAKILHYEWNDDFSAPRNLTISQAAGDWIIFLDADEYFTNLTAKNIRAVIEQADKYKRTGILVHIVNIDKNNGNKIMDTNFVLRIFKNQADLHYVGKIHEELRAGDNILRDITIAPPNILTIYHTGYSESLNKSKAERNLKILLSELAETEEPQRIYGYIAESYNGLEDYVNAEKFARLDIESGSTQKIFASRSYRIILNILARDFNRTAEREKFAELAVKDFPNLPEFTAELAECLALREDYQNAIDTMQLALQKFKNYHDIEPLQFDKNMAEFALNRIEKWRQLIAR